MKKNKKSKLVLFSVIGLAAISIGTVGFATWVTGLDKKTETVNTTITVDTASNKTCYVEAVLDDSSISLKITGIAYSENGERLFAVNLVNEKSIEYIKESL